MRCPDKDRIHLLINNVDKLEKWMEMDNKTDPQLLYWIPKYILMRNDKQFSQLGHMLQKMRALAESQDKIGWRNFTEGYISTHFYSIQCFHLSLSHNYLNGADWTRQFINKILQLTHLQWVYRNISLHDKCQGYLHNKQFEDLLREVLDLSDLSPGNIPESCRFLLEINFTDLASTCLETQRYWTLAVNAALMGQQLKNRRGAHIKQVRRKLNRKIPSRQKLGIIVVERQSRTDGMHCQPDLTNNKHTIRLNQTTLTSLITKRPHLSSVLNSLKSNKHLRKPN